MSRARLFDTVLDATGRPIVGATVNVYQPNTTTPISETLYADDIGGTTVANPMMTSADGSYLAYLDAPRRVDLLITAVGQTPRTVPDVGVFPDPADFATDGDIVALQAKVGSGVDVAEWGEFFKGTGVGTSAWLPLNATDVNTALGYTAADDQDLTDHAAAADPHGGYVLDATLALYLPKSLVDAKGDLLAGTAADTVARLAAGTDGFILESRASETTGLKWVAPGASTSPTTTRGDIIKRGAAADERLAIGTIGQRLTVVDIGSGVLEPRYEAKQSGMAVGSSSAPTTTSTSYVDLTDMTVTLTVGSSGILIAWFDGSFTNSAGGNAQFAAFSLDAAAEVGEQIVSIPTAGYALTIGSTFRWSGLAAGSHTVKVRWKTTAGTGTASTTRRYLVVMEG